MLQDLLLPLVKLNESKHFLFSFRFGKAFTLDEAAYVVSYLLAILIHVIKKNY